MFALVMFHALALYALVVSSFGDFVQYALDHPQLVAGLLGLIAPALIEVVKQPGLSALQRRLLAYTVSAVIGLLTVISLGQFNLADVSSTILITIAAAQVTYAEVWRPTGAAETIAVTTTL